MENIRDPMIKLMYRGTSTIYTYLWDTMMPSQNILSLISAEEINSIKSMILSPRYSGNNRAKMEHMDFIMNARGFTKFAGGTNRVVYEHPAAPGMVFKVAIDSIGISDNPAEFYNQQLLKPFCCKVFECSSCGTIASFEKVERITTIEEYQDIACEYYDMLVNNIIGKYVMEDIGINFFMNVGVRQGQGPVLLDFPYLFELDGKKLICNAELKDHTRCMGEIDYDDGLNQIICTKCGRHYSARNLSLSRGGTGPLLRSKGAAKMKVKIVNENSNEILHSFSTSEARKYLSKNNVSSTTNKKKERNMKISIVNTSNPHKAVDVESRVVDTKVESTTKPVSKSGNIVISFKKRTSDTPVEKVQSTKVPKFKIVKKAVKISNKPNNQPFKERKDRASVDTQKYVSNSSNQKSVTPSAPVSDNIISISLGKKKQEENKEEIVENNVVSNTVAEEKENIISEEKLDNIISNEEEKMVENSSPVEEEVIDNNNQIEEEDDDYNKISIHYRGLLPASLDEFEDEEVISFPIKATVDERISLSIDDNVEIENIDMINYENYIIMTDPNSGKKVMHLIGKVDGETGSIEVEPDAYNGNHIPTAESINNSSEDVVEEIASDKNDIITKDEEEAIERILASASKPSVSDLV